MIRSINKMSPIQRLIIEGHKCKEKETSTMENNEQYENVGKTINKTRYSMKEISMTNINSSSNLNYQRCEQAIMIYDLYQEEYALFRQKYEELTTKKIYRFNNISRLSNNDKIIYDDVINKVTDRLRTLSDVNDSVSICIMLEAFKNAFYFPLISTLISRFNKVKEFPQTSNGKDMYDYTQELINLTRSKCNDPNMPKLIRKFLGYSNNFQNKLNELSLYSRDNSGIVV